MKKVSNRQKKVIATVVLFLIGIGGFLLVLSSIGTLDNDFITISAQLSLNVRIFVVGTALMSLALGLYKSVVEPKGGKYHS